MRINQGLPSRGRGRTTKASPVRFTTVPAPYTAMSCVAPSPWRMHAGGCVVTAHAMDRLPPTSSVALSCVAPGHRTSAQPDAEAAVMAAWSDGASPAERQAPDRHGAGGGRGGDGGAAGGGGEAGGGGGGGDGGGGGSGGGVGDGVGAHACCDATCATKTHGGDSTAVSPLAPHDTNTVVDRGAPPLSHCEECDR